LRVEAHSAQRIGRRQRKQADYNLKYLIAAALLDDEVGPAQLEQSRVQAADAQALLNRWRFVRTDAFTAKYPHELNTRIVIKTKDGRTLNREQLGYEGGLVIHCHGACGREVQLAQRTLCGRRTTPQHRRSSYEIDERPIADLMGLLGS